MKANPLPSLEILNEHLNYDPDTGQFIRKKSLSNRVVVGSVAGSLHRMSGYILIRINGKRYSAHRLAYKMYYGSDPVDMIDHIDMDRSNNRINNLRDATNAQNQGNSKVRKDNVSGIKGVCWSSTRNKWFAQIKYNNKQLFLGRYKTKEEAALTYEQAAKKYFGEFARTE